MPETMKERLQQIVDQTITMLPTPIQMASKIYLPRWFETVTEDNLKQIITKVKEMVAYVEGNNN